LQISQAFLELRSKNDASVFVLGRFEAMNTYSADRQLFFRHLFTKPCFLLQHAGFLAVAVLAKAGTRLKLAVRPGHDGSKLWPGWLLPARQIVCPSVPAAALVEALPYYVIAHPPLLQTGDGAATAAAAVTQPDAEDYFAEQRWGFLLQSAVEAGGNRDANLERIEKWIGSHTDKADTAWETYSACERVANSLVLLACLPRQNFPVSSLTSYIAFLSGSLEWIYAHLEYYGEQRTNNHILNDARALIMGGVALNNAVAVAAGVKIFRAFLPRLVTTGGFLRERSSHYQLIVMNWVLDARKFLQAHGDSTAPDVLFLEDYVLRMAAAGSLLVCGDGELCATIGDVSPDLTPQETVARLATLYPDFWPRKHQPLQPCEIKDGWFRLSMQDGVVLGNFVEEVYPLRYPTHGHNDLTGFVWVDGGTTILTDPGRFRYTPDPVSLLQKSALGHNVPILNGFAPFCETLLPNGQWWPRPYASASAAITVEHDAIALSHNGFSRATPARRHVRRISLHSATLEVVDVFEGEGMVEADFCWHFSGAFDVFDEAALAVRGAGIAVAISLSDPDRRQAISPLACEAIVLTESLRYGEATSSLGLRFKLSLTLPARIMTRFSVSRCAE
jgi:hypothetical protein